jgi:hypothetical protein
MFETIGRSRGTDDFRIADQPTARLGDEPDLARTMLHEHFRVGSRCGYLLRLLAGVGWMSLPALRLLLQPTMILAGSGDPIAPWSTRASWRVSSLGPRCMCTTTDISA